MRDTRQAVLRRAIRKALGIVFAIAGLELVLYVLCLAQHLDGKFSDTILSLFMAEGGLIYELGCHSDTALCWCVLIFNPILGTVIWLVIGSIWKTLQSHCTKLNSLQKRLVNSFVIVCFILIFLSPFLLQKMSVRMNFENATVGAAKNQFFLRDTIVSVGNKRVFKLNNGAFEYPLMIHALDKTNRILCVYYNDIECLVFVVDRNGSRKDTSSSLFWAPYVVKDTEALVRMPTKQELDEALDWFRNLTPEEYIAASFPQADYGFRKIYADRSFVLSLLQNAPLSGNGIQTPWKQ